ncbi:hypothetical protein SAY86_014494 [Trapa natans]|uniref:Aminopeptidase P N-terminal domain-containing protein n=1 Tax=Trapa natans TaxID=22666 RepID=A0AAN7KUB1_TRANT|nr:hypothetical protein SAY86_014494 [Trapa natans]
MESQVVTSLLFTHHEREGGSHVGYKGFRWMKMRRRHGHGFPMELHGKNREKILRQESYFAYLFGVVVPGFFGATDVMTGNSILFAPKLPADYAIWLGEIKLLPFFQCNGTYGLDTSLQELERLKELGLRSLRTARKLLEGMNGRPATKDGQGLIFIRDLHACPLKKVPTPHSKLQIRSSYPFSTPS